MLPAIFIVFIVLTVTLTATFIWYKKQIFNPLKSLTSALRITNEQRDFCRIPVGISGPLRAISRELAILFEWAKRATASEKQRKVQREIVANISHDFRGPLTSIQGYTETLLQKGYGVPEADALEYLETILSNTKALSNLVNQLLDLARFDASTIVLRRAKFSVSEFASEIFSKFKTKAAHKGVNLVLYNMPNISDAYADKMLIDRALSNILENALYYTKSGGEILLSFQNLDGKLMVQVKDSGIGIAPDDLPYVFERFYRVGKDRSRGSGGTGLGLSISKAILDAHGSQIHIESDLGIGTTISFDLSRGAGTHAF